MALCSVDEVKAEVNPRSLTADDISALIERTSKAVAALTGCSVDDSGNDLLNLACIHLTAAAVLRKMRTNGELAARVKIGNSEQQNTIDQDIKDHEAEAMKFIKKYRYAGKFSIPYGRVGIGTVNEGD